MKALFMQVKREIWEWPMAFLYTPALLCAVVTLALIMGILFAPERVQQHIQHLSQPTPMVMEQNAEEVAENPGQKMDPKFRQQLLDGELFTANPTILSHGLAAIYALFVLVLLLVLPVYLLSTLYSDRRDQTILFWKSLPVSETKNALSKCGTGFLCVPGIYLFAATLCGALYLLALLIFGTLLNFEVPGLTDILSAFFGSFVSSLAGWLLLVLWLLPVLCWLLFSSALAKKSPFLLAIAAPLALAVLEYWLFDTCWLGCTIRDQIASAAAAFADVLPHPENIGHQLTQTLTTPSLWLGSACASGFLAASIWLRNNRFEI